MRIAKRLAALTALLAVAAMPAALAAERADVAVHAGGVDFSPNVAYGQAVLTVSGNGRSHRYELAPGQRLAIGLFDPDGQLLGDGTYRWELQLVPTESAAAMLRSEAAANGGQAHEPWSAQSGSFTIHNGAIAEPALVEVQARGERGSSGPAFFASGLDGDRPASEDDDAAIGSRSGVEAQVNAAASRRLPDTAPALLEQPDRAAGDDSDAFSAARGYSLERAAPSDHQLSAQPPGALAPRPRSDGSNGRPRS